MQKSRFKILLLVGVIAAILVYFCYNQYQNTLPADEITTTIEVLSQNDKEKNLYVTAYKDMGDYICTLSSYVILTFENNNLTCTEFMAASSSAYSKNKNREVKWQEGYTNAQIEENNQLKLSTRGKVSYKKNNKAMENILSWNYTFDFEGINNKAD